MKGLVLSAKSSGISKAQIDGVLADGSISFSDDERELLGRLGWILHISDIDTSVILGAKASRVRRGLCREAVQNAFRLFCLDETDPELEKHLRETHMDLGRMFHPDLIHDEETLEYGEEIIRVVNRAHGVLNNHLKK